MTLVESIKSAINEGDNQLIDSIDFSKSDEENISTLIGLGLLIFEDNENN